MSLEGLGMPLILDWGRPMVPVALSNVPSTSSQPRNPMMTAGTSDRRKERWPAADSPKDHGLRPAVVYSTSGHQGVPKEYVVPVEPVAPVETTSTLATIIIIAHKSINQIIQE